MSIERDYRFVAQCRCPHLLHRLKSVPNSFHRCNVSAGLGRSASCRQTAYLCKGYSDCEYPFQYPSNCIFINNHWVVIFGMNTILEHPFT